MPHLVTDEPRKRNGTHGLQQPSVIVSAAAMSTHDLQRSRYEGGWRAGKPEEDPEKTKRWGLVSAQPSEFLIRMRGGKVVSQGQGASCFKWPWDSVAVVPTTAQPLHFTADQITAEKVGVRVTGVAVYRIADPLIAFRMLNFSFPERAQEKLGEMLEEMFVGATRRLVANLLVEQCLTRRKDALAAELMREIAPVVSGAGQLEDTTSRGWGVLIDSIEIQDVRVMSQAVFSHMQARFRYDIQQKAREAELQKERAIKLDESNTEREVELARVTTMREVQQRRQAAEEQSRLEKLASEIRVDEARLQRERTARQAELAHQRQLKLLELQAAHELRRVEHLARVEAQAEAAQVEQSKAEVARARLEVAHLEVEAFELELKKQQLVQDVELRRIERAKAIENQISPQAIQLVVAQKLPELAKAFQQQMGEVHVTAIDGANPFGYVAAAVQGVLSLAKTAGLDLGSPESKA